MTTPNRHTAEYCSNAKEMISAANLALIVAESFPGRTGALRKHGAIDGKLVARRLVKNHLNCRGPPFKKAFKPLLSGAIPS